jgi:hypothetical protein
MPDEQVNIDINATDHASKPIDAVAAEVKKLEALEPEVVVTADAAPARKSVEDVLSVVDRLARDPATLVLTSNATDIARQITDLVGELDKLDADDPEVQVKAEQINSLQGDLDTLETKLRDINGIPVDVDTKPAKASLDEVGKSADSSKSALANMIGNSAQDLGSLGGQAGSAGVAIGQMAEYMADAAFEGEGMRSVLKSFGGVAVPIAAITVAVSAIGSIFQDIADRAARATDLMKDFAGTAGDVAKTRDAVSGLSGDLSKFDADARTAWGGFLEGAAKAAKSIPVLGGLIGDAGQNVTDVLSVFNKLGISSADIADALDKQGDAWSELGVNLLAAKEAGQISSAQYAGAVQVLEQYRKAHEDAAAATKFSTDTDRDAAQAATDLNQAYADAADASTAYADSQQRGADMIDRVNQLLTDQAAALNAQVDAASSAADANRAENKALEDYGKTLHDAKASTDDVVDSAIALAKAHQQTAAEQAKANGQTQTATANLDSLNEGLLNTAAGAKGPARDGILAYVAAVNQIPPEKLTEIQAAIDRGDLATAKALLDEASAPRTAAVNADANTAAASRDINAVANKNYQATVTVTAVPGQGVRYAGGRLVPELSSMPLPPGGGEGAGVQPVVNVTQYLPRGWRGDALGESRRAARRSGGLYHRFSR